MQHTEDCPMHGAVNVIAVHEGPPSMMGYGTDPDVLDLSCGHRLRHDPFDGRASISNNTTTLGNFRFQCDVCKRVHFMERNALRCKHEAV